MTILALTRLHYGQRFLDACIRSTENFAEKHIVVYTERHNFPGNPTMPCPDTREELYRIAQIAGGDRLHWIDHPDPAVSVAFNYYNDIDMLLELDSDEVIHQDIAADILRRYQAGELTHRVYRLPMIHHWHSFNLACTDEQWPMRLYLPHAENNEVGWYPRSDPQRYIHHCGYMIDEDTMRYKWMLSIHKDELRPEWFDEIWHNPDRVNDVHPVSVGMWNAQPFDSSGLPAVLVNHPDRLEGISK